MNTPNFPRNVFASGFRPASTWRGFNGGLSREFERMVGDLFSSGPFLRSPLSMLQYPTLQSPALQSPTLQSPQSGSTAPAVNVWESDQCYFVEAELPGVQRENLDLTVVGNELTIRGERKQQALPEKAVYHRQERGLGSFARVVQLPSDVNGEAVEATLRNGVLTLRLPKTESAKPRKITVAKA